MKVLGLELVVGVGETKKGQEDGHMGQQSAMEGCIE